MNRPIMSEILQLSVNERLHLVEDIWDSIQSQPEDITVTETEKKILERHLEAFRQHPEQTIPWEELKANNLFNRKERRERGEIPSF